MKVGSFSAEKMCGYDDAQSLAIYEIYFFASGFRAQRKKGVCKKK